MYYVLYYVFCNINFTKNGILKKLKWFFTSIQSTQSIHPTIKEEMPATAIKTYRHEFAKEFMALLSMFSKIHQFDDRHTYKAEWTKWTQQEEIAQEIDKEKRRLVENAYMGDIDDKMFKAGRYYFRKKTATTTPTAATTTSTTTPTAATTAATTTPTAATPVAADDNNNTPKTPQQQRRPYITMSKHTIALMDNHLKNAHSTQTSKFKPSLCYDDFYQTQMASPEMTAEIEKIIEKFQKFADTSKFTPDEITNEIIDKIKKTYKNRYYKYVSTHHNHDNHDHDHNHDDHNHDDHNHDDHNHDHNHDNGSNDNDNNQ
jgi:hypothetical protein